MSIFVAVVNEGNSALERSLPKNTNLYDSDFLMKMGLLIYLIQDSNRCHVAAPIQAS